MNTTRNETRGLPTGSWERVAEDTWRKICGRCDRGYRREYDHVHQGVCFYCGGSGFAAGVNTRTTAQLDTKERLDLAKEAKRVAAAQERAAIFMAANAEREAKERDREAAIAKAHEELIEASKWLDEEVGAKVTVHGTVVLARTYETASYTGFGVDRKRIIVLDCGDGVKVKTFTTAQWAWEADKGSVLTLNATVKKHTTFDGIKETVLSSPRLAKA